MRTTFPNQNCEALIRQEIARRGPMSFSTFVDLALYHPSYGYYNQPVPRRGRTGDYFTALQVSDLFPKIFADAIVKMKETLGSEQFSLIEVGSGNGEFLEGVLKALAERQAQDHARTGSVRVWAVERSRPARDLLYKRLSRFQRCQVVSSLDDIEWMGTLEGCIFSNELFDALPFERRRWNGERWEEICVDARNQKFEEITREISNSLQTKIESRESKIEAGHEIEWRPQIPDIYAEWSRWLARGYVLTVDYGHPQESFFSPTRVHGSWMCYHKHQATKAVYENIGQQDITAHVNFSQLVAAGKESGFDPAHFCSQGIFLSHMGQKRLEEYLATADETTRRHRVGAVQQLIHPDAMGEAFWVLLQTKGVEMPKSFGAIPSRLRRLV